ncbi:MAG: phytanoyl-CoA dioxygenase family protein [Spirulina sp. SIO3F2]|nr:phytanoyl-CoA dioxygenase family protein [Spirulina sp. SIO3F2]
MTEETFSPILTEAMQALMPSAEDVDFYQTHGWWVSKRIFSDEELDTITAAGVQHQNHGSERPLPTPIQKYLDWRPDVGEMFKTNSYIIYQNKTISDIGLKPILGAIAARLAGTDQIRLFSSYFVEKPPAKPNELYTVGYHTDKAYCQTCSSTKMLTAWIPLQDTNTYNGALNMLDGSHLWPDTEEVAQLSKETNYAENDNHFVERAASLGLPIKLLPAEVKKGQVGFHHCQLFHGSDANYSAQPRRALILHLQDGDNYYVRAYDQQGQLIVNNNDLMVPKNNEGNPDYSDSDFCPVIWG